MTQPESGPFAQYLRDVQWHLRGLPPEQGARVLAELADHLHDAAHEAGADPHDPVFQAALVQRLGSSRTVGRALARAYRSPQQRSHELINLVGGAAALLSAAMLVSAYPLGILLQSGWLLRTLLTGAPIVLLPTMVALHSAYRPRHPRWSALVLLCGLLGMLTFVVATVGHDLLALAGLDDTVLHRPIDLVQTSFVVTTMLIGLVGLWWLLLARLSTTTGIPSQPHFAWLSMATGAGLLGVVLSIVIGNTIIAVYGGLLDSVEMVLLLLYRISLLWWFVCYLGWSVGTGLWLLQRRRYSVARLA